SKSLLLVRASIPRFEISVSVICCWFILLVFKISWLVPKCLYSCLEGNGSFASAKRFSTSATAVCLQSLQQDIIPATNKEIDFDVKFNSCSDVQTLKKLHTLLVVSGKAQTVFISTKLVNLYALLGDLSSARDIFCQMSSKDGYTWNSMIAAYVRLDRFRDAMSCFEEMIFTGEVPPDWYTFPPVLKACGNLVDGKMLHSWVFKLGFIWDVFIAASLVHMYCRFGAIVIAQDIFRNMPLKDSASWNAIISGLCQNDDSDEALGVIGDMRLNGLRLDPVTVASILPACALAGKTLIGLLLHVYVVKHGLEFDVYVSNALINMYAKFGFLEQAGRVFDEMIVRDIVSWNSIIAAYEQNNSPAFVMGYYQDMQLLGFHPDKLTLVSLASVTAQLGHFRNSRSIHGFIIKRPWLMEDLVVGNAAIDMYAKSGVVDYAHRVFDGICTKDAISWNTMITGYTQNGFASNAVDVYSMMTADLDVLPNQATWVSILPAYSHLGAVRQGMQIHGLAIKTSFLSDVFVGTCLVDMYGKCGRLDDALSLFYEVPRTSSVPWNAIIACHGVHGQGDVAIGLFEEMVQEGVDPDDVTFLSLMSACSHSGLVDKGYHYLHLMEQYGMKPNLRHYGCMVDLFGRAGKLDDAYDLIKNMHVKPDSSVWGALLGACRIHRNIKLGKVASQKLFELDSENVGYYVLLSNMYANEGKWDGVDEVRSQARDKGLKKTPGWSSVEVTNKKVEIFYTGNKSHPMCDEIYAELRLLTAKMKNLGYIPDFSFVLQDVEDDEKEHILMSHSERLAIAYVLITTAPKSTIRIFKNLRVCGDCHTATKLISKITEREIIVRDSKRFHHFKDGACSCGDYW
ncbi:Pentatricopeptide repeat-containing protein, partial [Drosera capensis]